MRMEKYGDLEALFYTYVGRIEMPCIAPYVLEKLDNFDELLMYYESEGMNFPMIDDYCRMLIAKGLDILGKAIVAGTEVGNIASQRTLKKCGFRNSNYILRVEL